MFSHGGGGFGSVYLYNNNIDGWTAINNGLTNTIIRSLAVNGNNIYAGTYDGFIYISTNNGKNWTDLKTGFSKSIEVNFLAVNDTNIYAGTNIGAFLSTNDGANWTMINTGLSGCIINALAVNGNDIFAGSYDQGVFLSTNNGSSWAMINNGLTSSFNSISISALAVNGNSIFAGTKDKGVFLSTNNGSSWTEINNGFIIGLIRGPYINCLAVNGNDIFAGTMGDGVYLSTNNGSSWMPVNTGLTNKIISSFAINGTNIFAGTSVSPGLGGVATGAGGVFLSTNNGASWNDITNEINATLSVHSLAVINNNIFAGTDNGFYLSTNNGTNWLLIGDVNIRSMVVRGSNIFAATKYDVFLSTNNGVNWKSVSYGLPMSEIFSLAINETNVFAGTWEGVWKLPLLDITKVDKVNENKDILIFPNPASDFFTLCVNNNSYLNMTLNIYNVTGSLVKSEIFRDNKQEININNLNNGIYLVEIRSKGLIGRQKLIIRR